jgi:predicted dehydrogenase
MIKLGIIGAGPNAAGNAQQFAALETRCRIVAVVDPVEAAARKLASAHGAKTFAEASQLFDEVDAVVISSPNFLHPEQTIAAAQAGKHVWCEKPMALNDADAERMVAAVTKAGVASFVGFTVRFEPMIRKLKEIFESGRLGIPISIWSRRLCHFAPTREGTWRFDSAKSGGVMSELTAHEIDWMVDLAGDPRSIYGRKASRRHDDPRDNDHVWITLDFGNDFIGTIEGSQMSPVPEFYRGVIGTEGAVYTTNWGGMVQFMTPGQTEPLDLKLGPAFDKYAHFLDVIEGRCASVADVSWGRKIVRISDQAIASALSGEAIKFDAKN